MQDLLIDENYAIKLTGGDFDIGTSDTQHKELLLICSKGSFKENPASCVGLWNYLEAEDPADMLAEIKTQFRGDGMEVKRVGIIDGKLEHEAYYR